MRTNRDRLEQLAELYFEAEISPAEESELRSLIASEELVSEELKALKVMLSGFEAMATGSTAEPYTKPRKMARIIRLAGAVASMAAMVAVALVVFSSEPEPADEVIYCYINGEPITDITIAMEQTQYLEPLKNLSQSVATLESIFKM